MLTAIIIDDEEMGRVALREKILAYCPEIEVLGEAKNAKEGLALISKHQPDIIFLDIEMPKINGFEMLERLEEKQFHLIFVTAYDQYALKAIRHSAMDYLLKPVDIEELKAAVEKTKKSFRDETRKKLEVLYNNLSGESVQEKIALPTLDGLLFLETIEIIRLEAAGNYTVIHLRNQGRQVASRTLKDFEDILSPKMFLRTHHSHIINFKYIKRFHKSNGGQVELEDGVFVPVSRRKKDIFFKRFKIL